MIDLRLRRAVLVDTSAWFAALDANNRDHPRATRMFNKLAHAGRVLVVTNYIKSETYTLLRMRRGGALALSFLSRMRGTPSVRILRVTQEWELAAEELLATYRDHVFSYVDATSFVAMRELGVREVLTFDADFAAAGFTVLGA